MDRNEILRKLKNLGRYDMRSDYCDGESGRCKTQMEYDPKGEFVGFAELVNELGFKLEDGEIK